MSTYDDILTAVQSEIQSLSLTDIDNANVVVVKVPTTRRGMLPGLPGIVIAPLGPKRELEGTNNHDDISYPVLVAMVSANAEDPTTDIDRQLLWHEEIEKHFIGQRLSGVTSVIICNYDPRDVFDPSEWFEGFDVGWMVFRFVARELRG